MVKSRCLRGLLFGFAMVNGTIVDAGTHVEFDAGPFNGVRVPVTAPYSGGYMSPSYSLPNSYWR